METTTEVTTDILKSWCLELSDEISNMVKSCNDKKLLETVNDLLQEAHYQLKYRQEM